jgi:hypothetical protein
MAAFSTMLLLGLVAESDALRAKLNLSPTALPITGKRGRPAIPEDFKREMLKRIEAIEREGVTGPRGRRAKEVGRGYSDEPNDTDALIWIMRDFQFERLTTIDGYTPDQAERIVSEYAETDEFKQHLATHRAALSEYRARGKARR